MLTCRCLFSCQKTRRSTRVHTNTWSAGAVRSQQMPSILSGSGLSETKSSLRTEDRHRLSPGGSRCMCGFPPLLAAPGQNCTEPRCVHDQLHNIDLRGGRELGTQPSFGRSATCWLLLISSCIHLFFQIDI